MESREISVFLKNNKGVNPVKKQKKLCTRVGSIILCLALLCGVTKGFCGKKTSGTLVNTSDAMMVNTVRMLAPDEVE